MVVAAAIREKIEVPEGVEVIIENNEVSVKGPNGEDSRKFTYPNVSIKEEDDVVVLETAFPKKKDKAMIGTTRAHINNMIVGVTDGFVVGDGFVDAIGGQLLPAGMGAADGQTVIVKHFLDVLGTIAEEACEFDEGIAELCDGLECAGKIGAGDVAYAVHLKSVVHGGDSFRGGIFLFVRTKISNCNWMCPFL